MHPQDNQSCRLSQVVEKATVDHFVEMEQALSSKAEDELRLKVNQNQARGLSSLILEKSLNWLNLRDSSF